MSRYAAFLLFLAIVPWIFCTADPTDYSDESDYTEIPFPDGTTKPGIPIKDTTPTTAPTTTTAAPTTTTTAAPTTTTTAAPTTTTTAAPTTTTTAAPTTTTTAAPTTTTTAAPTTTSTVPTPTTTPTVPLPDPTARLYQVISENRTCLMVNVGLRIGFQGDKFEEMNLNPNTTEFSGSCGEDNSTLLLKADTMTLSLTFHNDSKKFSLRALNATGKLNSGVTFSENNNTLNYWQAALGSSYMCNKEQKYNITQNLTIFTFELHVQPFGVEKDSFSTAQECAMDDTSILIPIVVGAALAGLILIVVIAYVIGRRKTYVGYQTL